MKNLTFAKLEEKKSFIIEQASNQKVMCVTGNPLRDWKTEKMLAFLYSQTNATHYEILQENSN